MLVELLQVLARDGESCSLLELSNRLGVDQDLVRQMLSYLVKAGYLRAIGETCVQECQDCPMVTACLSARPPKAWFLTEKGMYFIERKSREGTRDQGAVG